MPEISIIVPVYNVEKYLEECIDSIISQSYKDFELLLIDDGSTDNSLSICKKYEMIDRRISVIHQDNQGLSGARNTGLDHYTGSYVTFIDSDDKIHPDYLAALMKNIEENKADIVICGFKKLTKTVSETSLSECMEVIDGITACKRLYLENDPQKIAVSVWAKLYSSHLFEDIRFPLRKIHEDEFITYKLFYKAKRIIVTKNKLYFYRLNTNGISHSGFSLKRYDDIEGLDEAIAFYDKEKLQSVKEVAIKHREFLICWYALEAKRAHKYYSIPKKYKRSFIHCYNYFRNVYGNDYCEYLLHNFYPKITYLFSVINKYFKWRKQDE